jgi:phosphatidylglycerophosphate synthase
VLAAVVVVAASVADTVDGALAVLTEHTTRLGYVYDSVVDRLAELGWLLALWLVGVPGYLAVAAGALSWIHEYTRSRANAVGMTEIGGATLGERPTRAILTVIGLGLAGLTGLFSADLPAGVATFAVAAWFVLAVIGFAQLFGTVHHALSGRPWVAPARGPVSAPRARPVEVEPEYAAEDPFDAVDLETIARMVATPTSPAVYTSHAAEDAAAADAAFDLLPSSGPRHGVPEDD